VQVYDRSIVLHLRVQALLKQFEELQRLRDRIRKVEARAAYARRHMAEPVASARRNIR